MYRLHKQVMPANRATFGVYNTSTYLASQNYMNLHENERNQDDNTPAYMEYDDGMLMNNMSDPQFTQDYSNHMYDIAHRYVNRHRDEHEAAASAAKRVVGGRRHNNRGRNTRGHIKRRSIKYNKRMRRTRRR
jgi:hypothetical protein